ncbi:MAG: TraB/GumN family protein [Bacteroidales bacterium]|nr:TraB/GumN family protein [Bacteroidales bacterium]
MNKMKTVFFLLVFSILINPVSAQLLWKVEGSGLSQASYLYGTMHILCPDDFHISEQVLKAYQNADALVLELDPTNPAVLAEMQQLSLNPGFENIYKTLPEEDYEKIDRVLIKNFGAGLDQLGVMKPFVLISMLTMTLFPCEQLESPEIYFVGLANEDGREIIDLETAALQMGIFDEIPTDLQMQEMLRMLDLEGVEEFQAMKKAYLAEDLLALDEVMTSNAMMKEWEHLILSDRNKQWVKDLVPVMPEKSLFIAVGAGHLPGEEGVIELLRKEGFRVTPVL